jgi:hypothetical protein
MAHVGGTAEAVPFRRPRDSTAKLGERKHPHRVGNPRGFILSLVFPDDVAILVKPTRREELSVD